MHTARCKRRPGAGAHGTPVLSVSGDQKLELIQNADLPGARAADLPRPVCSLNWSCGSRPARARCKLDPRQARPLKSHSAQARDSCALEQRADGPPRVRARPQLCLDDAEVGTAHVPQLAEPLEGVLEYLAPEQEANGVTSSRDKPRVSLRQMRRVRNNATYGHEGYTDCRLTHGSAAGRSVQVVHRRRLAHVRCT